MWNVVLLNWIPSIPHQTDVRPEEFYRCLDAVGCVRKLRYLLLAYKKKKKEEEERRQEEGERRRSSYSF